MKKNDERTKNFKFGDPAVEMKAIDPFHVALVGFRLSRKAFQEYRVEEFRELGIDLVEMSRIVFRPKKMKEKSPPEREKFIGKARDREFPELIAMLREHDGNKKFSFACEGRIRKKSRVHPSIGFYPLLVAHRPSRTNRTVFRGL